VIPQAAATLADVAPYPGLTMGVAAILVAIVAAVVVGIVWLIRRKR
jgi:hypothetical protein